MSAITSINKSISMCNKLNSTINNNISINNRYTNKIKESIKMIDKSKRINKSKTRMKNSNNMTINIVSNLEKLQKQKDNNMKIIPNIPANMIKGLTKRVKKIWKGSVGKGLKLGIKQDKKTNKILKGIKTKWTRTWVMMGKKLAPILRPALKKISAIMDSPAFKNIMKFIFVFLGAIINGVTILLDYLSPVFDIIGSIFSFMFDNAEYVLTILMGIATAIILITTVLGIYNLVSKAHNLITTIATTVTKALGAAQMALPIVFIISMIIILITIFITLIATIQPVRQAIADLTRGFFDFVEWGINGLIEGLAAAAEGIIRFAGDGINTFLNIFVNPFIEGINLIISGLNLMGAGISKMDRMKVDFSGAAESTGKFIRKRKVDLSGAREAVAGAIENFSAEELKKKLGIGKLQEQSEKEEVPVKVNKIEDDVNIADEDIKLMRDVAEREMIQNFVTLKPTVSMGDMTVNENADADRLLGKITEALVTEVTNSAQGVYA